MNPFTLVLPLVAAAGLFVFHVPASTVAGGGADDATLAAAVPPQGRGRGGIVGLRGEHGFSYSGSVRGIGPVASSGRIDFDGRGNASAWFTTVVDGAVFQGSFVGTYDLRADGRGSITIELPWLGRQGHGDFVVVDEGRGTFFTCTDPGYTVTGTTKRM